jgi:hypothetical protein
MYVNDWTLDYGERAGGISCSVDSGWTHHQARYRRFVD